MDKNFLNSRKNWLQKAKKDREQFKITDLGAGSKQMGKTRSVSELAKKASSAGIYGEILWKIAHHYQPKLLLELGTSIGTGSIHLKSGNPNSHLITVEGCDRILLKASQQFDTWNLTGITTICASFDEFVKLPCIGGTYDLIFLDGNHSGEATLRYIDMLFQHTDHNTAFILDDIRWSDGMWNCWNQLVNDDRFHVSIDLGRMGILWRRDEQTKEHFTIRPKIFKNRFF
ncbi:O-methyltransferase [Fluviicola taffensis]|uniref:O-methyltransferase n=1 Tax=Fluviicola taffensis TaxID=191579 RepID=UPI00145DFA96|nr:class I SAM-dependent methyltransferase [Fluviicola taffensis]